MSGRLNLPATMSSPQHTLVGHTSDVNGVTLSHDLLASCSSDKSVRLWHLSDFRELPHSPLLAHSYGVNGCAFSHDGGQLATWSTDGRCILWLVQSGKMVTSLQHPSRCCIRACAFSPCGRLLATGGDDDKLCLWDLTTHSLLRSLDGPEASIVAVTFTPQSDYLLAGSTAGDLRVWDAVYGHGRPLAVIPDSHDLGVTCVAVSPTYGSAGASSSVVQVNYLAVSGGIDNILRMWDLLAQKGSAVVDVQLRCSLKGHGGSILCCEFSPSGKYLASGSEDKTVRLWNPASGVSLHTIDGHSRYVTCCAFNKDGSLLATGSNDKMIKIWRLQDIPQQESNGVESVGRRPAGAWSVSEVCQWLRSHSLAQFIDVFTQNAIDGRELLALTDSALQDSLHITALGHRNKILRALQELREEWAPERKLSDRAVPNEFLCPITREVMTDPVIATDGFTYERAAISKWLQEGKTSSPVTNNQLTSSDLTPNHSMRALLHQM